MNYTNVYNFCFLPMLSTQLLSDICFFVSKDYLNTGLACKSGNITPQEGNNMPKMEATLRSTKIEAFT